ncbi:MAG: hypothetical protein RIS76_2872 [Verrucomicrobiota bacterium]|jgi:RNA polymerase sigma-70 factor (ECF subfamily)
MPDLFWVSAEDRFHLDPPDPTHPERNFDRKWALALLERGIDRLRQESFAAGRGELFEHASRFLMLGETAIPCAAAAEKLGMTEGALRVSVHRLRQRYRQLLRDEIRLTPNDPAQAADELQSLQAALASP